MTPDYEVSERGGAGSGELGRRAKRILYVRYTNPGSYPPLQASAHLLARRGWHVLFAGIRAEGTDTLKIRASSNIRVKQLDCRRPGWQQKLHYAYFCLWTVWLAMRMRPRWIYASEPLSCIPAWMISMLPGVRVVYHEHDSPARAARTRFESLVMRARKALCRRSALCILPNEQRLALFVQAVQVASSKVFCVWNCPEPADAELPGPSGTSGDFWLHYHGNLSPKLLPLRLIEALRDLPAFVKLRVVGYETMGNTGYGARLLSECDRLGVDRGRLDIREATARDELLKIARTASVGLAIVGKDIDNVNMRYLVGASNKPFDYLACALPLIVTDLPAWKETYVDAGYGIACDPENTASVVAAVSWYVLNPSRRAQMGELGRRRIVSDWNYANSFAPVLAQLEAGVDQALP